MRSLLVLFALLVGMTSFAADITVDITIIAGTSGTDRVDVTGLYDQPYDPTDPYPNVYTASNPTLGPISLNGHKAFRVSTDEFEYSYSNLSTSDSGTFTYTIMYCPQKGCFETPNPVGTLTVNLTVVEEKYCLVDDSGSKFIFYAEYDAINLKKTRYRESKATGVVGNLGDTFFINYFAWATDKQSLIDQGYVESAGSCDLD